MTYFKKSLIFNPIVVKGIGKVEWQRVGRHDGVLKTDNPDLSSALTELSKTGRFGVTTITAEEYEGELKKNPAQTLLPWSQGISASRLQELAQPQLPHPEAAASSEPKPAVRRARAPKPSVAKGVLS